MKTTAFVTALLVFASITVADLAHGSGDTPASAQSPELDSQDLPDNEVQRTSQFQYTQRTIAMQSVGGGAVPDFIRFNVCL